MTAGDTLTSLVDQVASVKAQLAQENLYNEFVIYVKSINNASNIEIMKQNYKLAHELVGKINLNIALGGNFASFSAAYTELGKMEAKLNDLIYVDNSKRLLACIAFLSDKETEEEWDAHYDELLGYVIMAREIILSGEYDPYYNDAQKFIEDFAPMSEYFYTKMQNENIKHIRNELARYDASDKYFEKFGICVALKEFIAENNVNTSDPVVVDLLSQIDANLEALKAEEDEYRALLSSNTDIFVEKCKALVGVISYEEMKRACDEASIYFYAMDVTAASAQDAINIYNIRCKELNAAEAHAEAFMMSVAYLLVPGANTLEIIIEASAYLPMLVRDVPGVSQAIEALENAIVSYNDSIAKANSELYATRELVGYLRNYSGADSGFVTLILSALDD
jgi:hypothetical protein